MNLESFFFLIFLVSYFVIGVSAISALVLVFLYLYPAIVVSYVNPRFNKYEVKPNSRIFSTLYSLSKYLFITSTISSIVISVLP